MIVVPLGRAAMTEPTRQDMIEALKFCLIDLAHVINLDRHRPAPSATAGKFTGSGCYTSETVKRLF